MKLNLLSAITLLVATAVANNEQSNVITNGYLSVSMGFDPASSVPFTLTTVPGSIQIGVPQQAGSGWLFDSSIFDIYTAPDYYDGAASSSAAFLIPASDFVISPIFTPIGDDNGTASNEWFFFQQQSVTVQGQFFYNFSFDIGQYAANQTIGMAMSLQRPAPFFTGTILDQCYTQALINKSAFAFDISYQIVTGVSGFGYIGNYTAVVGFPDNTTMKFYPVVLDEKVEPWSFPLYNVKVGNSSLGWNGYVSWNTGTPYSLMPTTAFFTFLAILPLDNISLIGLDSQVITATFDCPANLLSLPNITYYLGSDPITFTGLQYAAPLDALASRCQFAFAANELVPPPDRAFTIGSILMNNAYTVFDFDLQAVGYLPRLFIP